MTVRRAELAIAACVIAGIGSGLHTARAVEQSRATGTLTGHVLGARRQPVARATVVLCDQASGIPLDIAIFRPFTESYLAPTQPSGRRKNRSEPVLHLDTDNKGRFRLEHVPPGVYRLIAQSWLDAERIEQLLERNGKRIELHGVAERVSIAAGQTTDVTLRPLGQGVLKIDQDLPNDETLLVLSTAPTRADPILGFAGWSGPFMQNMLGGNRMPAGETTVFGLPEGTIHLAMFAADSVPGWTVGSVEIRSDVPATIERIPFVCSWSNGRHEPPEELRPLVEELKALEETGNAPEPNHPLLQMQRLLEDEHPEGPHAHERWLSRHLDHRFKRPSGGEVLLKDLAAASRYIRLPRTVAKKKEESKKYWQALNEFQAGRVQKEADATSQPQAAPTIDVTSPESFFPDDPQAGIELTRMWAVKWEALKTVPEAELLEIVRKGLRQTTADRKDIIKTIGSRLVWHMSPSHPAAVDILYAASFEPDLKYDAFYYGLTTAKPKPTYVLDRLAELALDGYNTYRIAWGTLSQTDEFLVRLQAHLTDGDDLRRHQARNIIRIIEGMKAHVYDVGPGRIELDQLRQLRDQDAPSLERVRQTLLAGDSTARLAELEHILTAKVYFLLNDNFVAALESCSRDQDAGVRRRTARLAGLYWLWGDALTHPAMAPLLMRLSSDPVRNVRFVAVEKGLFNLPDKTDDVLRCIIDLALTDEENLPEKLYPRIGAVLRRHRDRTREILLAYRDQGQYPRDAIEQLYRDALRADPP